MRTQKLCISLAFVVAASLSFAQSASTAAKRPMTFEDMMAMKRLGATAVSPKGAWLAYSVGTVNLAENRTTDRVVAADYCGPRAREDCGDEVGR